MGPPKRRARKTPYSEIKRRYDCFEYRWDAAAGNYYLYNPWTGETIFSTNLDVINRQQSMWAPIEKYPSEMAETLQLYPEFYCSRRWGRRSFKGWLSIDEAALHMTAVARGFLARLYLRRYYQQRYYKVIDQFSGYYYYVDTFNPELDTVWVKPRLAFPDDIRIQVKEDPDDYLQGKKYSKQDFKLGPMITVKGLNKLDTGRAELQAFLIPNEYRKIALRRYSDIDLEQCSLNDMIIWMDSERVSNITLNEYHLMRTAIVDNDWERVIYYLKEHSNNLWIQIYGFHSFSKTDIPMNGAVIDFAVHEVITMACEVIRDNDKIYPVLLKIFAMRAFHNILSARPGRLDYLNTDCILEQGEARDAAVEAYHKDLLTIFNKYLVYIPNETIKVYERGERDPHDEIRPLPRSVEIIEVSLQCLSLLAQEQETKELMAFSVIQPVLYAMDICKEAPLVILHGLRLMYNLCYRCESGQEAVLTYCDTQKYFGFIHQNHSGDFDVMRQCRRLELALKKGGWRGHVESLITKEMHNEELSEEYLQISEYESAKLK